MDEPISRRGGTWLVLLMALAIAVALGWAVASVGSGAISGLGRMGPAPGGASSHTECLGCSDRVPGAASATGDAPRASVTQATGGGPSVRSTATGGRAAAAPVAAPQQVALPTPAAAAGSGGLCATIGRTGPPLLQTVLSPVAAVCDVLL